MIGRRRRPGLVTAVCLTVGAVAGAAAWATRPADGARRPAFTPCIVWALREIGRCGTVAVYEDRDHRRGRTIPIHVVVLRARGQGPLGDPVVLLAGGPGQGAAARGAAYAAEVLGDLRARHAIILADQRGTGHSGALDCDLAGNGLQAHVAPFVPGRRGAPLPRHPRAPRGPHAVHHRALG